MSAATKVRKDSLSGAQKCAVLCIALGAAGAAKVLQQLAPAEVERVTREIAAMGTPDPDLVRTVLEEFRDASRRPMAAPRGGADYASTVLEQAVGAARARPMLARIAEQGSSGLARLQQASPGTLAGLLREEHPQTVAVVLAQLSDDASLALLEALGPERARDVLYRVARLGPVSADTLGVIERELLARLVARPAAAVESHGEGGPERVARILNRAGEKLEKPVMEELERRDHAIAARVKNAMFTFEDLLRVGAAGIQRVLREIDGKELALALKVASDELKAHLRKGMSERAASALDEEIEMMGPVRVKDVEAAHARIVESVRALAQSGEIQIEGQGGGDELV